MKNTKTLLNNIVVTDASTTSTNSYSKLLLNPWWISGFCDAESSFSMFINKSDTTKIGFTVSPCFNITLHIRDLDTLKAIQVFFNGIGKITTTNKFASYRVRSRTELQIIIDHFTNYPLNTSKLNQFFIFVNIYNLIGEKAHIDVTGFLGIAALANKLNHPLSDKLLMDLSVLGSLPEVKLEHPVLNNNPKLDPF